MSRVNILQLAEDTPAAVGQRHVHTLASLATTSALEGEQVGVIAVSAKAQVRPPYVITPMGVEDELSVGQLHHA